MNDPYRLVFISIFSSLALGVLLIFYKFIFPKKNINPLMLIILISILPVISIFRPGTYQSGDLTSHSVFLQSFFENIRDGIFIPQWSGGLCGGYGCPIFLFLYTMPYYIGSIFHFLGFSFLDSIKLFLASSYILSALTMYLFAKDEFPKGYSAVVVSLLYIFAPIHLIETHFIVSAGTVAAFIFIPLSFLLAKKSLEGKGIYISLGALNFLALFLSHPSAAFVITIGSLIYSFIKRKNNFQIIYPILSIMLGLGLSSFYIFPVLFEAKQSWIAFGVKSAGDFKSFIDYLISPSGFGLLFQGNHGESRLIVGYSQLFIVIYSIYMLARNKFQKKQKSIVIFLLLFFLICFTLMQSFTKIIWDHVFFLQTFQFVWRLLVPISFATAYLGGFIVKKWKKTSVFLLCFFTIFITILNWGNRKMVSPDPNAYAKQISVYTEYYDSNNPLYLERYKQNINNLDQLVAHRPSSHLQILEGTGEVKEISRTQINHEYIVYAKSNLELSENTHYFPGWKVYVNQREIPINITNKKNFGALTFKLSKGLYYIKASFEQTPIRKTAGYIFAISLVISVLLLFTALIKSKFNALKLL